MNTNVEAPSRLELPMPRAVEAEVAADIEKESVFVSQAIERITVAPSGESAVVELRSTADVASVMDKAARFLDIMSKHVAGYEPKVFAETERQDKGPYERGVNEALVARGWVHDYGKGQVAYNGPVLRLARLIDRTAAAWYASEFGAGERHFPALVDAETLHKCGYFDSHPNAVSFVGNMMEDFDAIEEFRVANSCSEGAHMPPHDHVHMDGMCLNPAACFPAYPTLTGKKFETVEAFTWLGRVYRYESRNISGLDRLYEFNVRELVFIGSDDQVADVRNRALPLVANLAAFLDLDCTLQTATDPFFATVSAAKKFFQSAQEVKAEIKIPVLDANGEEKKIACGSVNLHGNFFGERFDISDCDGAPAMTGCVGLGIERWVLAAFTQHGLDADRWPAPVAAEIFGA